MSKIEDRVRKVAEKIYDKTLGPQVAKMTLEQQVQGIKKFMRFPGGMPRVRRDLLEGLPTDIKEKAEEGLTKEQKEFIGMKEVPMNKCPVCGGELDPSLSTTIFVKFQEDGEVELDIHKGSCLLRYVLEQHYWYIRWP